MPFRCRQKMQVYSAGKIFYRVGTPNSDTGIVEYSDMPQQVLLPDAELTDLVSCLKAGVSLEKVNCKLISPDSHALAERLGAIKEDDTSSTQPDSKNED